MFGIGSFFQSNVKGLPKCVCVGVPGSGGIKDTKTQRHAVTKAMEVNSHAALSSRGKMGVLARF